MRYFMELSYKGTHYNGWQVQDNAPSIQGEVQKALSTVLRCETTVTGAGRTDTGVHALKYVAHFDYAVGVGTATAEEAGGGGPAIADLEALVYHLNAVLPKDIAIRRIWPVRDDAHARFDAIEREYRYFIMPAKSPFVDELAWQYCVDLDIDKMNEAAAHLLDFDDFTTFAKLNSSNKTNICTVTHAGWEKSGEYIVFTIRANRFLRNMVRAIAGSLVEVGRGVLTPDGFRDMIAAKDLSLSRSSAPARGLYLADVKYSDVASASAPAPAGLTRLRPNKILVR